MIKLGDKVQDSITGFTGIVVCVSHWFNGCTRIMVAAQDLSKDTKPVEVSFDAEQLNIIQVGAVLPRKSLPQTPVVKPVHATGGPFPDAARRD